VGRKIYSQQNPPVFKWECQVTEVAIKQLYWSRIANLEFMKASILGDFLATFFRQCLKVS